jgi:nucleoside-diphosphate-sugar epimerase
MADERFLVTGALGCIGAWAAKRLIDEDVPVWSYDLPGNPHRLRLLMDDAKLAKLNIIEGDITDQELFEKSVVDNGITHILHLAALQVPMVRANPVQGARVNVVGSTIVLETAKRHADQVQGICYASSVAVYGPPNLYPAGAIQHDAPHLPTTLYGVQKMADEWTAKIYWQDYGLRTIGIRPYFVYGPGRDQGISSTPTKAMASAAAGRPYHISFSGTAVYQHAEDVAAVAIRGARTQVDGAPCFNLAGSVASMDDVIDAIDAAVPEMEGKISAEPVTMPFPEDMDGSALEAAIGKIEWRPFKAGVAGTIEHFKRAIRDNRIDIDRAIA